MANEMHTDCIVGPPAGESAALIGDYTPSELVPNLAELLAAR